MLKVSSISSRSSHHSSHQHLSMLVGSESGMLMQAMEHEPDIKTEPPTLHASLPSTGNVAIVARADNMNYESEPPQKRIKLEPVNNPIGNDGGSTSAKKQAAPIGPSRLVSPVTKAAASKPGKSNELPQSAQTPQIGDGSIVTNSSNSSNSSSSSNNSLQDPPANTSQISGVPNPTLPPVNNPLSTAPSDSTKAPPEKATKMSHLSEKYLEELEYMLREFRKLERQLLGAKGAAQLEESAGSRERREKLHSFILHLEDTVRQIEAGCALEAEIASDPSAPATEALKQASTKAKEDEDSVQRLEEHILANLLPVKVRLKKQLAAQQGASKNPPGMPAPRRGSLQPPSSVMGKGTFAAAAEERRKQAEAARLAAHHQHEKAMRRVSDPTQFGKPLGGGGSSLTQKLHGRTLGSQERKHGHGVGSSASQATTTEDTTTPERKILYAGMVPQSKQHQSGIGAASGVHELVIQDPHLIQKQVEQQEPQGQEVHASLAPAATSTITEAPTIPESTPDRPASRSGAAAAPQTPATLRVIEEPKTADDDESLTEDEKKRLRKKRRKRKLKRIAQRREKERQRQIALQQSQASQVTPKSGGRKKAALNRNQGKKKGPRAVEYICSLCSEAYSSTCDYNPWWALAKHDCPKCRKNQIPRIDISSPANAIEYHPALLAHADDGGSGGAAASAVSNASAGSPASTTPPFKPPSQLKDQGLNSMEDPDSESDLSELSDGSISDDSVDSDDSEMQSMTPAERAEHETFGHEYKGPVLADENAGRLLVLMAHASTCPCRHQLTKHRDVCRSVKYMMLHVRDCPGTTSSFDVCPFPWCRKVKHLLYHLVSCTNPGDCSICSPKNLSSSLKGLVGLNEFRMKKHRQRLIAASKAMLSNAGPVCKPVPRKVQDAARLAKGRVQPQSRSFPKKASGIPPNGIPNGVRPVPAPSSKASSKPHASSTRSTHVRIAAPSAPKVAPKPGTIPAPSRTAIPGARPAPKTPVSIAAKPTQPPMAKANAGKPAHPQAAALTTAQTPKGTMRPASIAHPSVETAAMLASHQKQASIAKDSAATPPPTEMKPTTSALPSTSTATQANADPKIALTVPESASLTSSLATGIKSLVKTESTTASVPSEQTLAEEVPITTVNHLANGAETQASDAAQKKGKGSETAGLNPEQLEETHCAKEPSSAIVTEGGASKPGTEKRVHVPAASQPGTAAAPTPASLLDKPHSSSSPEHPAPVKTETNDLSPAKTSSSQDGATHEGQTEGPSNCKPLVQSSQNADEELSKESIDHPTGQQTTPVLESERNDEISNTVVSVALVKEKESL